MTHDRQLRGQVADARGRAAEDAVKKHYLKLGANFVAQRWRGKAGEIDIIFRDTETIICVEVKSSSNFEKAAAALGDRQIHRLLLAAEEFIGTLPSGALTPLRFDVALVDGRGAVEIIKAAISA